MATKNRKTSQVKPAKGKPHDVRKGSSKRRMPPAATMGSSPDAEPIAADGERQPVLDDESDVEGQGDDREHQGIER